MACARLGELFCLTDYYFTGFVFLSDCVEIGGFGGDWGVRDFFATTDFAIWDQQSFGDFRAVISSFLCAENFSSTSEEKILTRTKTIGISIDCEGVSEIFRDSDWYDFRTICGAGGCIFEIPRYAIPSSFIDFGVALIYPDFSVFGRFVTRKRVTVRKKITRRTKVFMLDCYSDFRFTS